jgi:hypothetical protein
VRKLLQAWRAEADVGQRHLVYQRRGRSEADVSLAPGTGDRGVGALHRAHLDAQREAAVPLALRPGGIAVPPSRGTRRERSAAIPKDDDA